MAHKWGWEYFVSSPVVEGGSVFFGSGDGWLYCLNKKSGAQLWKAQTNGRIRSTPAIADGKIYFASFDGVIRCLENAESPT